MSKRNNLKKVSKDLEKTKIAKPKTKDSENAVKKDNEKKEAVKKNVLYVTSNKNMQSKIPAMNNIDDIKYAYKPKLHENKIYVHPNNRVTSEIMTKFEYCDIISQRAKQIENDLKGLAFSDTKGLSDPLDMAKKELMDKQCPLDIERQVGIYFELWHANEMTIPNF